ncbi:MAG: class I SAM-dependent methyltransferase [Pseudomonadales bacterium]|jgi:ubiquinone/menaquinone biosynthesis C-methylase UbiE|nr:methyltransferase domain-containing protein [Betaproteobacteria bacterium]MDG1000065.1 class I SAM-dependent methyltransferase [Pseudomonadales bacterium]|tara:strand:+ start:600 stop:1661 length:1062 start_codon:yes stop_codon:yes gene_type:complete
MSTELQELESLSAKVGGDAAGALGVLLAYIGDEAGVYRALDEFGPATTAQLAGKTNLDERYLQEFLSANAGHGYVTYYPGDETFAMSEAQAAVFAREGQPTCMQGFFQIIVSQFARHETALETFKTGKGRAWGDHDQCCFCGTDRFFRPGYEANILENWIPALSGVEEKLRIGGKVADIGCGHGTSTIMMAKAFPNATFHGFDFHGPSVEAATKNAKAEGVDNVQFFESAAKEMPDNQYDFACIFDALHDMGDPVGAATRIFQVLSDDATLMLVEPMAEDSLQANLENNPMSSTYYSFSTLVCVPTSKAQEVGLQLGAQAGQARLTGVLEQAGFTNVRRASANAANMVLEVRA